MSLRPSLRVYRSMALQMFNVVVINSLY